MPALPLTDGVKAERIACLRAIWLSPLSACCILTWVEFEMAYSMQSRRVKTAVSCADATQCHDAAAKRQADASLRIIVFTLFFFILYLRHFGWQS